MSTDGAQLYDDQFYSMVTKTSSRSADIVVPLVLDHLAAAGLTVGSVLDLGCGAGDWLAEFRRRGVDDIVGIDGEWAVVNARKNIGDAFRTGNVSEPVDVGRRFDLSMSLEVAEHIDEASAATIVASLVAHSDTVMFSAAIPGQGGADHVNEQWPSWWAGLFAAHGYRPDDAVRPLVWNDPAVAYWYAQNLVLYRKDGAVPAQLPPRFDVVHPTMWRVQRNQSRSVRFLAANVTGAVRHRLGGLLSRRR